jgi:hypothetical protein
MKHEQAIQSQAVEAYLLNQMTPVERDAFEEHYFSCEICAEDLRMASQLMEDVRRWSATEPEPQRLAAAPMVPDRSSKWDLFAWLRPQVATPAFATVLAMFAASFFHGTRLEMAMSEPIQVQRTVLMGQSRGVADGGAARRFERGKEALFEFDAPMDAARNGLRAIARSSDGRDAFSIQLTEPEAGAPINIQVKRLDLAPGTYTLVLAEDSGVELERYPFQIFTR